MYGVITPNTDTQKPDLFMTASGATYFPVPLLQTVKAFGLRLLANVGLVDNDVFASPLLS